MGNNEKSRRRGHKRHLPAKIAKPPIKQSRYHCAVCQQSLYLAGGYDGTGLCGPCATGKAESIEEVGETW